MAKITGKEGLFFSGTAFNKSFSCYWFEDDDSLFGTEVCNSNNHG